VDEDLEDGNGDDIMGSQDEVSNGMVKLGVEPAPFHRVEMAVDLFVNYLPDSGPLAGFEFRLAVDNVFDKDHRIHPNAIEQPGTSVRVSIAKELQWLQ